MCGDKEYKMCVDGLKAIIGDNNKKYVTTLGIVIIFSPL